MATTRKKKATTRRTTSKKPEYLSVDLPQADSKDFCVVIEAINTEFLPHGFDWQYSIVNKQTGVVEMRATQLTLAIVMMQSMQQMFDKMLTGEVNGYGFTPNVPKGGTTFTDDGGL